MRLPVVWLVGLVAYCLSGCFLVGYEPLPDVPQKRHDAGVPDAAQIDLDASDDAASAVDDDGGMDSSLPEAGTPYDASSDGGMDARLDGSSAGDASSEDGGGLDAGDSADAEAGASDGSVDRDGSVPDASVTDAGRDSGPPVDTTPTCDPLAEPACVLECRDLPYCAPLCQLGQLSCEADCSGADVCQPVCEGVITPTQECHFNCRDTGRCAPTCKGPCTIDCIGSDDCDEIRCENLGTGCLAKCTGATSCKFKYCWADSPAYSALGLGQRSCPGNEIVCGRLCPL
jgi:hypothetical protein